MCGLTPSRHALVLKDDRLLVRGLLTCAAPGADADLSITSAVDVRVKKTDNDTKRTPSAADWRDDQYGRIDLADKITLTSFRKDAVEVEITRNVLGNVDSADNNGKTEMVNIFENLTFAGTSGPYPNRWGWFSWPWWWHHFNGVGRITWSVTLEPKAPFDLGYTWNYYWR